MIETFPLKGSISEVNFGYNVKMEVYTNLSSDITKLYAIGRSEKYLNLRNH
ncbi:MAG: hypothetical protein U9N41_06305 [Euryarchaeota archaeon]|nr:hypothetical protein [Euryarchaeota archaeon]